MANSFFDHPILNSPYERPARHWELDKDGQPTLNILPSRRRAEFVTPIPKPKKRKNRGQKELALPFAGQEGLAAQQPHDPAPIINEVRSLVDAWRALPHPAQWQVTATTARLLQYWRQHDFQQQRPFFCQIEAVETAIWLIEVANHSRQGKRILAYLAAANLDANPGLTRLALKLATGAGKTTVMAMLIAWQTVNAVRHPNARQFTRGFLITTPGLTIKERLRVLLPHDPDNYYQQRELLPPDLLAEMGRARIVITNYHAYKRRDVVDIAKGGRQLLEGRSGDKITTLESAGQMLQRVMPSLMGMKNILALNDEAHHCYREKPQNAEENRADSAEGLSADEKKEAEKNNAAARLWISGLEAVQRKLGLMRIVDLSATPSFLRGSGYLEGTLFPWTLCDFSLMDAIECGIVKLPRVPVAENIPGDELPKYRNLWENVRSQMPHKGRSAKQVLDPLDLPTLVQTALQALYGHYEKTFYSWQAAGAFAPPCFIVVCQNTAISKQVYDYISGFYRASAAGGKQLQQGRLPLLRNFDEQGLPLARPNTLLIDSEQLEAGDALDDKFHALAADEIARFRRELVERSRDARAGENLTDQQLLREVMNTVGKPGRLGGSIRCVVSVSMLTEGWDANTVTHVLGLRAFGTQLLCEQVIGRALRRQSYALNAEGQFDAEYADVFGIPFDFTAKPVIATPKPPRVTVEVRAVLPERAALEIRFPRVAGYRVELPEEVLQAHFNDDSTLHLTPDLVGPTQTHNAGIIGEAVDLTLDHLAQVRPATLLYHLTKHLLLTHWRDADGAPKLYLFGQLKRIAQEWLDHHLRCSGGASPALLLYQELADMAANRIMAAITRQVQGARPIQALLDPYNQMGSTRQVRFFTTKADLWQTSARHCPVNWVVLDSDWEGEFCRVAEAHPQVRAYVKNQGLGFTVPYRYGVQMRNYLPDFIVLIDDGRGADDVLHLVVEIKGYRREDAKEKKTTMETQWLPAVNRLGAYGRWNFAEFTDIYTIQTDFARRVEEALLRTAQAGAP